MTDSAREVHDVLIKWARRGYIVPEMVDAIDDDLSGIVRPLIASGIARHRGSLAHDLRMAAGEVTEPTRAERLRTLAEWLDGSE